VPVTERSDLARLPQGHVYEHEEQGRARRLHREIQLFLMDDELAWIGSPSRRTIRR
jgi:hypothetical protein